MRTARHLVLGVTVLALLATGCGGGDDEDAAAGPAGGAGGAGADRILIATTVAPITSIVANVVGDRADVVGIVPEGTNSHTFEPLPSDAELLSRADVLYLNGLQLEEPTRELAEANLADHDLVELGPRTITEDEYVYDFSFPEEDGRPNPHLWTDPTRARRYAEIVRDDMTARDPDGADVYAANCERFSAIVAELDAAMREAFATVPVRKLLTYHDAYAYFAQTYDWEVIGAIQVSDFEDPTPREVADLIEQVRAAGVPAIFGSEVFPSPVLEQIGREAGVEYVGVLRDDLPGAPGDPEHSWFGLVRSDFVTMTTALGGDASALAALTGHDAAPDEADYPAVSDDGELIRLDGVTCAYGRRRVLADVDLVVGADDFVGVLGPSGSGKTTLLRLLLGVLRPSTGSVVRRQGLRVGYVPQVETVDWSFPVTVAECVLMARTLGRTLPWPTRAERREVGDVLDRLGIPELRDRHIRELSGGQQQRVFLARALLGRPQLVLLDEPTSGVDVRTRHEVLHLLDDLHRDGLAVVLTTHDLNGMAAHLPQLVCLNGAIVGRGAPREVLCAPVLERTFGARMEILEHAGLPVVFDRRVLTDHVHHHDDDDGARRHERTA